METTIQPLVRDLLAWLAAKPRSHADVMETWRTSCPRLPVWEECTDQKFVVRRGPFVEVSSLGRAFLCDVVPEVAGFGKPAISALKRRQTPNILSTILKAVRLIRGTFIDARFTE